MSRLPAHFEKAEQELRHEPNNQVDPNAVAVVRLLARLVKDCDLNQASYSSQRENNTKKMLYIQKK